MAASRVPLTIRGQLFITSLADVASSADDVDRVVCLVEQHELDDYPHYADWVASDPRSLHFPIVDHGVRTVLETRAVGAVIADALRGGERVVIHCFAGFGRSSLVATAALVELGYSTDAALDIIKAARPNAGPESQLQRTFIEELGTTDATGR